ncbi:phosphopyruvate hydratase [Sulfobacillus acidophilus TPY]|uniref:Enolase n=1 Tax=Sulfobacillus acidophilus (strain ATCC 700253 / DSM 10332 / NAL) TaxID=679936 RepID=G8U0N0_SULAD|nr:phosphopyruvate hydratase [Sulfobacillus acidophilus TPY]AEW04252.1 Enolase [Sulfobacillus acidophilus DSM 10332]
MMNDTIRSVQAFEILDSRGNPTLTVRMTLEDGTEAFASVPSGASTGIHEAVELRDGGARFQGKGVQTAVRHVNEIIAPQVVGMSAGDQADVDHVLQSLDGTMQKSRLGSNALLGVSMAALRAAAVSRRVPLYRYIGGAQATTLPVPLLNVLNGGAHADNNVDIQEFMIVPAGAGTFSEAMRMASETYHALKALLKSQGLRTAVGDEGGFAPDLRSDTEALDLLLKAIQTAGLEAGKDIVLALDVAASELYREGTYHVGGESKTAKDMVEWYRTLVEAYPIVSIEDGLAEDDWAGWSDLRQQLGDRIQLVGDDLFVTNPTRIVRGIEENVANAVLIKLNQIGTVSETLEAIHRTHRAGWQAIVSHRSGETEDTTIADLTVGVNGTQIKTGAPARSERVAKYNRLLLIEADDPSLEYAGWEAFHR